MKRDQPTTDFSSGDGVGKPRSVMEMIDLTAIDAMSADIRELVPVAEVAP